MKNWDKLNAKGIFKNFNLIIFILAIIVIIIYIIILHNYIQRKSYINQLMEIVEKNEETIFSVEKIYLCSSANAIDTTEEKNLKKLDLYQYTDIAISINNFIDNNGLTNKNTVKELYIDNIDLTLDNNIGTPSLLYTNLLKIGNREVVEDFTPVDRIDFNIIYNNEENESADYTQPTFYTDCSNPITLRYINNLGTEYSIKQDSTISFDGSILKNAGISIDDINCKVKFKINIVNNEDDYFSCWINLRIPLDDIYKGTTIKSATTSGTKYVFLQLSSTYVTNKVPMTEKRR